MSYIMCTSGIIVAFMLRLSHQAATDSSFRENIRLVPMPDSYDLDRGLLLSVQAIQVRDRRNLYLLSRIAASSCRYYFHRKDCALSSKGCFACDYCFRRCWKIKDHLLLWEQVTFLVRCLYRFTFKVEPKIYFLHYMFVTLLSLKAVLVGLVRLAWLIKWQIQLDVKWFPLKVTSSLSKSKISSMMTLVPLTCLCSQR